MKTPITVTFSPDWWERNYYCDPARRVDRSTLAGVERDAQLRDEFLLARYGGVDLAGWRGVRYTARRMGTDDFGTVMLPGLLGCRVEKVDGLWWRRKPTSATNGSPP